MSSVKNERVLRMRAAEDKSIKQKNTSGRVRLTTIIRATSLQSSTLAGRIEKSMLRGDGGGGGVF